MEISCQFSFEDLTLLQIINNYEAVIYGTTVIDILLKKKLSVIKIAIFKRYQKKFIERLETLGFQSVEYSTEMVKQVNGYRNVENCPSKHFFVDDKDHLISIIFDDEKSNNIIPEIVDTVVSENEQLSLFGFKFFNYEDSNYFIGHIHNWVGSNKKIDQIIDQIFATKK
jgi:hypothetical protein